MFFVRRAAGRLNIIFLIDCSRVESVRVMLKSDRKSKGLGRDATHMEVNDMK